MPLEQIRSAGAFNAPDPSPRRSSFLDYSPPTPPDLSDTDDNDGKRDSDTDCDYTPRAPTNARRNTDTMSLAKLGGVGGVTRSGSWGRHSIHGSSLSDQDRAKFRATDSPRVTRSSLLSYREVSDDEDEQPIESAGMSTSSTVLPYDTNHTSTASDHVVSAKAPSASSRASTGSSAAAFSLRSVSHRSSEGSVSSVASSSTSRGAPERVTTKAVSQSPCSFTDITDSGQPWTKTDTDAASDGTAHDSETHSASVSRRNSASSAPHLDPDRLLPYPEQDPFAPCSSSHDGPSSRPAQIFISPRTRETLLQSETTEPLAQSAKLDMPIELVPRPDDQSASITLSPTMDQTQVAADMQASPEELLSIAASGVFSPLVPRRHSGMFMLRSRSQLAMHPTLSMSFTGAGGGRAAARDRARKHTGWENAPFSVLEAQRHARNYAFSQPASPGSELAVWDTAKALPTPPSMGPDTTSRSQSPKLTHRRSEQSSSPLAQQQQQPPLHTDASTGRTRPSPMRQRSEYGLSRSALSRIDTELGLLDATRVSLPSSADSVSSAFPSGATRASVSRSPSSSVLSGSSLLRTPTTEEWSRLLESQGVDLAGRRSRTGTNRSTGSAAQLVGRLAMSALQPTNRTELDDDSDIDSDDSDDQDLGAEVLEKLKQLGLSCATSRNGSVLGEDLASLSEEDEDNFSPVSPQVNKLRLDLADPEPQTPTASTSKALHPDDSPLAVVDSKVMFQSGLDRETTLRLPRSKKPTVAGEAGLQLQRPDSRTGKSINDYDLVSDVGRGAYGLVKKARKRAVPGQAEPEVVIIKYIIKSRILADCWRRHRVLGPIPVEIHVMDQLRRIPYNAPLKPRPWSPSRPKTVEEWRSRRRNSTASERAVATSHPNLCQMIEFFEDHEFYYLVMPCFGKGQDLFDYVEGAPDGLAIAQCRSIFGQVADALWFLHLNNIVHRDVKDENVILDGEGNAQLIDFGSAAHVRPGKLFDTFSGTLDYAAAEILQGEKYSGQPQDIWALGVVGFVLLCGECPFWNGEEAIQGLKPGTRAAQTLEERCLLDREAHSETKTLSNSATLEADYPAIDPACPPIKGADGAEPDGGGRVDDFADLISRCLEVDPETRPTAGQICQHRFLAGQQGWTGPLGWQRLKTDFVPSCTEVAVRTAAL